jgi:hypothetical protein
MSRGNPITSTNKSTKLGLANSTRGNMVEPSIKPTILKESKPTILKSKVEKVIEKPSKIETKLQNLTNDDIKLISKYNDEKTFIDDAKKVLQE